MTYEEYLQMQKKNAGNATQPMQNAAEVQKGAALDQKKPDAGNVSLAATTREKTQDQQSTQQEQQTPAAQGFVNPYQSQLDSLYDRVMNWGNNFSYDAANDPLYQQYKNQYAQMGNLAMQDTIGNASALTGGYGNSWAATAGNQANQAYLQQLAGKVPELYEGAYNRYLQEGQNMQNQLGITSQLYADALQDYWKQQEFAFNQEQAEHGYGLDAFNQAMTMLQMGMKPSAELLALAGLTEEQAAEYLKKLNGGGAGSGGNQQNANNGGLFSGLMGAIIGSGLAGSAAAGQDIAGLAAQAAQQSQNQKPFLNPNYTDEQNQMVNAAYNEDYTPITPKDYQNEEFKKRYGIFSHR